MIYYILFFGLFITSLFDFASNNAKVKYRLFVFWIVVFVLFKALRWETGTDWAQYYNCFKEATWNNFMSFWRYGEHTTKLEPGYVLLNVIIKTFFPHYTFFLLITNAFILWVFGSLIRKFIPQYSLIALLLVILSSEIFPVRQTLPIAIFCYSLIYVYQQRCFPYLALIILAVFFHRVFIIIIPFYWFLSKRMTLKSTLIIYLTLIFFKSIVIDLIDILSSVPFINTLTGGLLLTYQLGSDVLQNSEYQQDISVISQLFTYANSILMLVIFFYARNLNEQKGKDTRGFNIFLNIYICFICINVISLLPGFFMLYRVTNIFAIGYPMCIAMSLYAIDKKYILLKLIFVLFAFIIKLNSQPCIDKNSLHYDLFVPYCSVFDKEEDIPLIRKDVWPYRNW